jgi:hypothetical protein
MQLPATGLTPYKCDNLRNRFKHPSAQLQENKVRYICFDGNVHTGGVSEAVVYGIPNTDACGELPVFRFTEDLSSLESIVSATDWGFIKYIILYSILMLS